jgi:DedD protein
MASGGRRSAGERVLEGKHVIGLFMLMLLFSGVFFTLGYVMGHNQYDGQVSAATKSHNAEPAYVPKSEPTPKKSVDAPAAETENDPSTSDKLTEPTWDFAHTGSPEKPEPRLDPGSKTAPVPAPLPASKTLNAKPKAEPPVSAVKSPKTSVGGPLVPTGTFLLQVAALTKRDDALAIASSLQKRHFAAYVAPPQKDNFYRVQVGPFKDQKSSDAAKKGLEGA